MLALVPVSGSESVMKGDSRCSLLGSLVRRSAVRSPGAVLHGAVEEVNGIDWN